MGNAGRVLMIPKGDYNPATPYEMLDCVYYNGRSYVCKQASTGHAPTNTTYWQALTGDASAEIQALTNQVNGNWSEGGKNLFDPSAYSSYKQSDGSYRLTGSQANAIRVNVPKSLVGVECTASIYLDLSKESAPTQVYICATVSGTTSYGNRIGANSEGVTKITFTPQSVSDTIGLTFGSEGSNYFTMTDLQLEKGTEVTEYQPYAKTNVQLTADVAQLNVTISDASSERDFFEKLITKLHNDITVTQKVYLGYALFLNNNSYSFEFIKLTDTLSRLEAYQSSRLIVAQNNNGTLLVKTVILTDMST